MKKHIIIFIVVCVIPMSTLAVEKQQDESVQKSTDQVFSTQQNDTLIMDASDVVDINNHERHVMDAGIVQDVESVKNGAGIWTGFYYNNDDGYDAIHQIGFALGNPQQQNASLKDVTVLFEPGKWLETKNNYEHDYNVRYMSIRSDRNDVKFYDVGFYQDLSGCERDCDKNFTIDLEDIGMEGYDKYVILLRGFNYEYANSVSKKFQRIRALVTFKERSRDTGADNDAVGVANGDNQLFANVSATYHGTDSPEFNARIYLTLIGIKSQYIGVTKQEEIDTDASWVSANGTTFEFKEQVSDGFEGYVVGLNDFLFDCDFGHAYDDPHSAMNCKVDELGFRLKSPEVNESDPNKVEVETVAIYDTNVQETHPGVPMREVIRVSPVVLGFTEAAHVTVKSGKIEGHDGSGRDRKSVKCENKTEKVTEWKCSEQ